MNKDTSFKKFHCQIKQIEVNINENLGSKNYLRVEMVKLYKREHKNPPKIGKEKCYVYNNFTINFM